MREVHYAGQFESDPNDSFAAFYKNGLVRITWPYAREASSFHAEHELLQACKDTFRVNVYIEGYER